MPNSQPSVKLVDKETAHKGFIYRTATLEGDEKFAELNVKYIRARFDYAFQRLTDQIMNGTNNHMRGHREATLKSAQAMRDAIEKAITKLEQGPGITRQSQLQELCQTITQAVHAFRNGQNVLHTSRPLVQVIVDIERRSVDELFELKKDTGRPEEEEVELSRDEKDMSKLLLRIREIKEQSRFANEAPNQVETLTKKLRTNISFLEGRGPRIAALTRGVNPEELENMPEAVQQSIQAACTEYIRRLDEIARDIKSIGGLEAILRTALEALSKSIAGIQYFSGLVNYKGRNELQAALTPIEDEAKSLPALKGALEKALGSLESTELPSTEKLQEIFLQAPVHAVATLAGRNSTENLEAFLKEQNEPQAAEEIEQGEEASQTSEKDFGQYRWNMVEESEAVTEATRRMTALNPLIASLYKEERWHDLRLILEKLILANLKECKLSQMCVGSSEARFTTKEDLFRACFPKCYEDENYAKLPGIKEGERARRFEWGSSTKEECIPEVRRRMFHAWPLLQEYYQNENWQILGLILNNLRKTDPVSFKIQYNVFSGADSPFHSKDDLIESCFPEAMIAVMEWQDAKAQNPSEE
ncbi:MAG: hypothetical protein OEY44_03790 [Candidatus Peregrinibacteria bacterium]|nr:hypothetical protein [Candidatus Peregrinibacteria bacterium]